MPVTSPAAHPVRQCKVAVPANAFNDELEAATTGACVATIEMIRRMSASRKAGKTVRRGQR